MKNTITVFVLIATFFVASFTSFAEIRKIEEVHYALEVQNTGAQIKVTINGQELYNDTKENSSISQRRLATIIQLGKNDIKIEGKIVNDDRPAIKIRVIKSSRKHISFVYKYEWDKKSKSFSHSDSFEIK